MCGLYASIGFVPDETRIDLVAHRGPDGRGFRTFESPAGPVALGHRRLAIIDVSDAGLQPMCDRSCRYWLIFNGEIYNYVELRKELEAKGETFATETDSEVLLRAFMLWGQDALHRLIGMFALVIWDDATKQLFVARDRFGIKPLYWVANREGVAFASEIKQLIGLPGAPARMNLPRVSDYLAFGMSDHTAETMFAGVMQVRGGECAVVDAKGAGRSVETRRWYAAAPAQMLSLPEGEAAGRFREVLEDAVRIHLRSDVPVGSCLSGGLDSSSIVCLMADRLGSRGGGAKVHTISAVYDEKSVDEKPFMDAVIAHAGAAPHFVFPRADDVFARAAEVTWHQDEPFGSSSIFAQWCVFAEASRAGLKVMLDGQGADEQLAGYHWSFPYYMAHLLRHGRLLMLLQTMRERRRFHHAALSAQLRSALAVLLPAALVARVAAQRRAMAGHVWLSPELVALGGERSGLEQAVASLALAPVTDIATLCVALTHGFNLQMLLHWEDRNSMAHSIEARVPFVDHRLVELSLALGNEHKIVGGDTKRVLRRAMSGALPDAVRDRRDKLGFATPEEIWFRGPLRQHVRDGVEATLQRYPSIFDARGARALTSDMLEGRRRFDFTLWRIVNLGLWGEAFGVAA